MLRKPRDVLTDWKEPFYHGPKRLTSNPCRTKGVAGTTRVSHTGRNVGIAIVVIVIVIIVSGFIPYITATHTVEKPYSAIVVSTYTSVATEVQTLPVTTVSVTEGAQPSYTTTQIVTQSSYSTYLVTQTSTSTQTCTQGWLQALFSCS